MANEGNVILEVKNLKKYFKVGNKDILKAVDNVSFAIKEGETLGLVGESGCGKTTCGRTVIGMYDKTDGEVLYKGKPVHGLKGKAKRDFTKEVQIIFQDQVGLNREHANRFVHEFSGGQRQRIGIARALAVEPKFILCDEPISALDVSIQAQVANLLIKLQKELGLTYLFIAHDLSMVKHISDRVAVMYLGSMVELAESEVLYSSPKHPYTEALMSAIPIADPDVEESRQRIMLEGDVPSPINTPPGCKFQGRCSKCMDICKKEAPLFKEVEKGHFVACHLYE